MARSPTSTGEKSTKGQNVLPQTPCAEWGPDNLEHPVPQLCKIFDHSSQQKNHKEHVNRCSNASCGFATKADTVSTKIYCPELYFWRLYFYFSSYLAGCECKQADLDMQVKCAALCREDYYELSVTRFPRYPLWIFTQEDMNISGVAIVLQD